MDDKKRDLIPVAAIALFLVIIIALCAVRLHQRRGDTGRDRRNGKHADMVQRGTGRVCRIRDEGRSGSDGRNNSGGKSRRRKGDSRRMRR